MYFLIAILLIIVAIFGISSGMQSYATAQQAQAQIEVAKVAQISSWGNLITILTLALIILVVLAVIAFLFFRAYREMIRKGNDQRTSRSKPITESTSQPQFTMNDVIQLKMMDILLSMSPSTKPQHLLDAPAEEQPAEEPFPWLR